MVLISLIHTKLVLRVTPKMVLFLNTQKIYTKGFVCGYWFVPSDKTLNATARQSVQKMETRGNRSESFYFVLKPHILTP